MADNFYRDEVLSGRTPVGIVAESANAFHHTKPSYPVHIVAIPRQFIDSLLDCTDDAVLLELFAIIRSIAAEGLAQTRACRVVTNLGEYQDSKYLHWHIISGPAQR